MMGGRGETIEGFAAGRAVIPPTLKLRGTSLTATWLRTAKINLDPAHSNRYVPNLPPHVH
jgi:hypothetical protein